jgi:hypothetical protein
MVVEGGWAGASAGGFVSTPEKQARYLVKQSRLLEAAHAIGLLQLTPTDLDVTTYPENLRESVRPFATLGVVNIDLAPKPALRIWDSLYHLPRR